jgi:hypothetical protein
VRRPLGKEKHHYLRNYIAATRHVRTQYVPPRGDGGTVFIDLFAGPGKARIRDSGEFIEGSPLIAVNEQSRTFTLAARRDFHAARDWVPSLVGPLDRAPRHECMLRFARVGGNNSTAGICADPLGFPVSPVTACRFVIDV